MALVGKDLLASGSWDKGVKVWKIPKINNLTNNGPFRAYDEHKNVVNALISLEDERFFVSGGDGRCVIVWDLEKNKSKIIFDGKNGGHKSKVVTLVNLDNGLFASGSADKNVKVFNITSDSLVYSFESNNGGHSGEVTSLINLGNKFASGSKDGKVKIWANN